MIMTLKWFLRRRPLRGACLWVIGFTTTIDDPIGHEELLDEIDPCLLGSSGSLDSDAVDQLWQTRLADPHSILHLEGAIDPTGAGHWNGAGNHATTLLSFTARYADYAAARPLLRAAFPSTPEDTP